VAEAAGTTLEDLMPPDLPQTSPTGIAQLQFLAAFWPRAAGVLSSVVHRHEKLTITGLARSVRAGRWQSLGQSEVGFDPMTDEAAARSASAAAVAPGVMAMLIAAPRYWGCEARCAPCPATYNEAFSAALPVMYLGGLALAALVLAPAIWTVLRSRTASPSPSLP
jgi:hypothetical protein